MEQATQINYLRAIVANWLEMAVIELSENNLLEAEQLLIRAEAQSLQYSDLFNQAKTIALRARLFTRRNKPLAAKVALTQAADLFERLGMRRELAEAREELRQIDEMGEAPSA